ncbi:putative ribosome biogenesis protein RLP24 [Trichoplax sp. H2]|uniref:Probable ribosome biogenesis protein RLP24 n=1 Tax=Trichoplax adhaerens TaxID=10228 RepID=B3RS54_TRIAD|nr:hypothetical protein TRIADDRAFT_54477 [Trichoplax adhaerens]EDV26457.1 hypothetical protein TRIADDRAFT_54477 [Trichoplax adhaerens]RDD40693.1 putative ribosome biogenesis protein RLP24 [Trichoplax sp. H2]|eukprot:XP_002110453.1 hypothetical protein TRIADDRAFT_54477 [Trichoplax adhaerens]
MRLVKCYFCSSTIYPGHGIQFVRNDNKVFKFCRAKCHKAFKKHRNPRKVRWTKAFRKSAGKELAIDSTFEFERNRNIPVKYNRELWNKSLEAIKRVQEIKMKRQHQYVKNRLKANTAALKEADYEEVKQNIHILEEPKVKKEAKIKRATQVIQEIDMDTD